MSRDLVLVDYESDPPLRFSDAKPENFRPLGTVREVKALLEQHLPEIEWETEPSLLSIMKQAGSEIWKDWDEDMLERASHPKRNGIVDTESLVLRFYGLPVEEDADVSGLNVDVHAVGNPYAALKLICDENGWIAAEPNPGDRFIDFEEEIANWEHFQANEEEILQKARERQEQKRQEIASHLAECRDFLASAMNDGLCCPKCGETHSDWRCVEPVKPADPDRLAYFVCRSCGSSVERKDFE